MLTLTVTKEEFPNDRQMQISQEEGAFLSILVRRGLPRKAFLIRIVFQTRVSGAKKCIEVGVFTGTGRLSLITMDFALMLAPCAGYSSLSVALALPVDGKIVALDVSVEWTTVAKKHWVEAGVDGKIDLRIAPAVVPPHVCPRRCPHASNRRAWTRCSPRPERRAPTTSRSLCAPRPFVRPH